MALQHHLNISDNSASPFCKAGAMIEKEWAVVDAKQVTLSNGLQLVHGDTLEEVIPAAHIEFCKKLLASVAVLK